MIFLSIQSHSQPLLSNAFTHSLSEKISGQIHQAVTRLLLQVLTYSYSKCSLTVTRCSLIANLCSIARLLLQVLTYSYKMTREGAVIYIYNAWGFCSVLPQSKQTLVALHHEGPYHLISMEEHYCISISPLEFCFEFESSFV